MSRRRNSALRKEQEQFAMLSNKLNKILHQKENIKRESNTIAFNSNTVLPRNKYRRNVDLIAKSKHQEEYIAVLTDPNVDIVVGTGPAGTGKTYLAMLAAVKELRAGTIQKIVLTRPAVGVDDEKHGFLPGDLNAKMEPWTRPLLDVLAETYTAKEIQTMLADQVVEISPLAFMRGRTFKNSWIILDEAQNATPSQVKMLLTRIGEGSKVVVTGDTDQADRKRPDNGLADLEVRLQQHPVDSLQLCRFDKTDIQRHPVIEQILNLYG